MSDQPESILRERAQRLAAPRGERGASATAHACALFERNGITYAIDSDYVLQVVRVLAPTPLPLVDPCWRGLTSLHGELIGIVDLAMLIDPASAAPLARVAAQPDGDGELALGTLLVMVIGRGRAEFGLIIDALLQARALEGEVIPLSGTEGSATTRLVEGATPDGVRVVRVESLLADPRLTLTNQPSSRDVSSS